MQMRILQTIYKAILLTAKASVTLYTYFLEEKYNEKQQNVSSFSFIHLSKRYSIWTKKISSPKSDLPVDLW